MQLVHTSHPYICQPLKAGTVDQWPTREALPVECNSQAESAGFHTCARRKNYSVSPLVCKSFSCACVWNPLSIYLVLPACTSMETYKPAGCAVDCIQLGSSASRVGHGPTVPALSGWQINGWNVWTSRIDVI